MLDASRWQTRAFNALLRHPHIGKWGLRKYAGEQELIWPSGDRAIESSKCEHEWATEDLPLTNPGRMLPHGDGRPTETDPYFKDRITYKGHEGRIQRGTCVKCGAWRGAFGLEPTVEMYVEHTVLILREIRRVLRKDGVVFWNLGDSYWGGGHGGGGTFERDGMARSKGLSNSEFRIQNSELKPKDLCLIPFRVALAAQADGWWVRSDIIWSKPNPMPESCTDRPTDAYEHILMFTKSARYFWDAEAVKEGVTGGTHSVGSKRSPPSQTTTEQHVQSDGKRSHDGWAGYMSPTPLTARNLRNVWELKEKTFRLRNDLSDADRLYVLAELSRRGMPASILDTKGGQP